ncbi:MAG: radical SAM protein [Clostridia bacterium]|nr:radical SAM protein [Clostridia bacterium]
MNDSARLPSSLTELLAELDSRGITDFRRYHAVRKYLNFRAREKDIPISGTFELTPLCNLDCKMCYVHLKKEQLCGAKLLTFDEWKKLADEAIACGMMYARLTGGECLTYPHFKEFYLYLQSKGVEVTVLTNGVLLNEEMIEFFKNNPPAAIQITLYGASDDAYVRVTGCRAFTQVISNVKSIMAAKLPLSVVITPNPFMTDGEEAVRLVHSLGLPITLNSGLMTPREETGRKKQETDAETYVSLFRLRKELQGEETERDPDSESSENLRKSTTGQPKGVTCGAGRSAFSISWRGEMRPCNTFPGIAENVLEKGFLQAWKNVNSFVKEYPLPTECEGCEYKKICKHCVAEHASGAATGHANPAVCLWIKRLVAEGLISK